MNIETYSYNPVLKGSTTISSPLLQTLIIDYPQHPLIDEGESLFFTDKQVLSGDPDHCCYLTIDCPQLQTLELNYFLCDVKLSPATTQSLRSVKLIGNSLLAGKQQLYQFIMESCINLTSLTLINYGEVSGQMPPNLKVFKCYHGSDYNLTKVVFSPVLEKLSTNYTLTIEKIPAVRGKKNQIIVKSALPNIKSPIRSLKFFYNRNDTSYFNSNYLNFPCLQKLKHCERSSTITAPNIELFPSLTTVTGLIVNYPKSECPLITKLSMIDNVIYPSLLPNIKVLGIDSKVNITRFKGLESLTIYCKGKLNNTFYQNLLVSNPTLQSIHIIGGHFNSDYLKQSTARNIKVSISDCSYFTDQHSTCIENSDSEDEYPDEDEDEEDSEIIQCEFNTDLIICSRKNIRKLSMTIYDPPSESFNYGLSNFPQIEKLNIQHLRSSDLVGCDLNNLQSVVLYDDCDKISIDQILDNIKHCSRLKKITIKNENKVHWANDDEFNIVSVIMSGKLTLMFQSLIEFNYCNLAYLYDRKYYSSKY